MIYSFVILLTSNHKNQVIEQFSTACTSERFILLGEKVLKYTSREHQIYEENSRENLLQDLTSYKKDHQKL